MSHELSRGPMCGRPTGWTLRRPLGWHRREARQPGSWPEYKVLDSIRSPLALGVNHRVRAPLIVAMLAAAFAVGLATGIFPPRTSSGAGHVADVATGATSTIVDSWRLSARAAV